MYFGGQSLSTAKVNGRDSQRRRSMKVHPPVAVRLSLVALSLLPSALLYGQP
jgi:hypothetical protein